ncbi:MAG: PilN domain-containing protein [Rhodothermales bacterium]
MKKRDKIESHLGVFATTSSVTGVLMRETQAGIELVNRFVKHRLKDDEMEGSRFKKVQSGMRTGSETDFTLQVASAPGSEHFMNPSAANGEDNNPEIGTVNQEPTPPFLVQIREIVSDCRAAGFSDPQLSFAVGFPDINFVEMTVGAEDLGSVSTEKGIVGGDRKRLLKLLAQQYAESFETERVDFLPMSRSSNMARFLAVVPVAREPVVPTLRMMALQMKSNMPTVRSIRTDVTVLSALIAQSAVAAKGQRTAVVRVGTDDTLILLYDGPQLQYYERLRSITTYDSPEKVCSRIMLQQDESKIGELDNVLILSDGRVTQLQQAFESFYPDAVVEPFLSVLEEHGVRVPAEDGGALRAGVVMAVGTVLIEIKGWTKPGDGAGAINLLPRKLLPKETGTLAVAWHTFVMLAVLFGVTFIAVTSYMENQRDFDARRQALMANPPAAPISDPAVLQHRVDSLRQANLRLTRSLRVLDSLLVGSDRWSRFMEHLTRATKETGVWIKRVNAQGGRATIEGAARTRSRVADFARELDGSLTGLASRDVKDKNKDLTIYEFKMSAPVPSELPKVAEYLRESAISDRPSQSPTNQ